MSFDIVRVARTIRLARKRPRIFAPALFSAPLAVAPILAGVVGGRRAFYIAAGAGLMLVILYALIVLQPLVRFLPPLPAELSVRERLSRSLFRRPLGMMLGVGIGVAIWLALWAVILRDRSMLELRWEAAWLVGVFATFGGIAWWEIFHGKEARRRRDELTKKAGRQPRTAV